MNGNIIILRGLSINNMQTEKGESWDQTKAYRGDSIAVKIVSNCPSPVGSSKVVVP